MLLDDFFFAASPMTLTHRNNWIHNRQMMIVFFHFLRLYLLFFSFLVIIFNLSFSHSSSRLSHRSDHDASTGHCARCSHYESCLKVRLIRSFPTKLPLIMGFNPLILIISILAGFWQAVTVWPWC